MPAGDGANIVALACGQEQQVSPQAKPLRITQAQ